MHALGVLWGLATAGLVVMIAMTLRRSTITMASVVAFLTLAWRDAWRHDRAERAALAEPSSDSPSRQRLGLVRAGPN